MTKLYPDIPPQLEEAYGISSNPAPTSLYPEIPPQLIEKYLREERYGTPYQQAETHPPVPAPPIKCPPAAVDYKGMSQEVYNDIEYKGYEYYYKGTPVEHTRSPLLKGAFGSVDLITFAIDADEYRFVEKMGLPRYPILDEIAVVEKKAKAINCPGVLPIKVDKTSGRVFMPWMHGDLKGLCGNFAHEEAVQVLDVMAHALMCMFENGAYYYDIKPKNTLYRCYNSNFEVLFGDLGSMIPAQGSKTYSATHPPPEYFNGHVPTNLTKEQTYSVYSYLLALMYIDLRHGIVGPSWARKWEKFQVMGSNYMKQINKAMPHIPESVLQVLVDTLEKGAFSATPLDVFIEQLKIDEPDLNMSNYV